LGVKDVWLKFKIAKTAALLIIIIIIILLCFQDITYAKNIGFPSSISLSNAKQLKGFVLLNPSIVTGRNK